MQNKINTKNVTILGKKTDISESYRAIRHANDILCEYYIYRWSCSEYTYMLLFNAGLKSSYD